VDGAFHEFRAATKFQSELDKLVGRDEFASAEPHKPAKSSHAHIARRHRLLSAQNPLK
jgi:hypothetical protein